MNILPFLFKRKNSQKAFLEITRAIRVLASQSSPSILVIDSKIINGTVFNHGISAEAIVGKFVIDRAKSLLITNKELRKIDQKLPFPDRVYYKSLSDSQLACLGVAQKTNNLAIHTSLAGKISIAYQNSIKIDLSFGDFMRIFNLIAGQEPSNNLKNLIVEKV